MSEVTLVVVGREEVNCGGETVGRLVPPSVVSAMVGAEHISGLGDNRVDFASFLVVLTLQVSGEILKKDYKDAIHPQAKVSIVYWHKEKHHGKNHSYFPSSKSHSCVKGAWHIMFMIIASRRGMKKVTAVTFYAPTASHEERAWS